MKKSVTFFLVLFFFSFVSYATNRALLIGVSQYEDSSWKQLSSLNDISILQQSLSKDFEIMTLLDKDATYKNIKTQLTRLCNSCHPGDTILIHFSGHGQQMVAIGTEEVDGLDEALVPYDAYLKYKSGFYEGQCHLRDNEFSSHIKNIRNKLNGKGLIVVILDTCHSGNADRDTPVNNKGVSVERGVKSIFGLETLSAIEQSNLYRISNRTDYSPIDPNGCNIIYISACHPRETDKEMKDFLGVSYGPLSYCFSKAYKMYGIRDVKLLLDEVAKQMYKTKKVSEQNPMFTNSFGYVEPVR